MERTELGKKILATLLKELAVRWGGIELYDDNDNERTITVDDITEDNAEELLHSVDGWYEEYDDFRYGEFETGIPQQNLNQRLHPNAKFVKSVGCKMYDGSYVGWNLFEVEDYEESPYDETEDCWEDGSYEIEVKWCIKK